MRTRRFAKQRTTISCQSEIVLFVLFSLIIKIYFRRQYFALDDDQRENLRRERRRLQEQLRRVRRQDRLQQRNTPMTGTTTALSSMNNIDHHSPSSHSTNPSPTRHLPLSTTVNELPLNKTTVVDTDLSIKNEPHMLDEQHSDLFIDNHHVQMITTGQYMSTSMDPTNSNSQSGFGNYFNSTSLGEDGNDNNDMISPTSSSLVSGNGADSSALAKRRKKSEKDLKWVRIFHHT
jgi:hypothetical protein